MSSESRSSRARILFLAHRVPFPPNKGDRIRTFHVLQFLAKQADVYLACLADEPVAGRCVAELQRYCQRVVVVPQGPWARRLGIVSSLIHGRTATEGAFDSPALQAILRSWSKQIRFHGAWASASSMVPYLRLEELAGVPAVIDLVDVDSQKWLEYADSHRGPKAWLFRLENRRLRKLEQELPTWARAVTLVSRAEADLYRDFCAPGPVYAIPNGVDLEYFRPIAPGPEAGCIFVGALDYHPNVDAARWFCQEVWPHIHSRRQQDKVLLVGRRPTPAVKRLAGLPGVELVGQVQDVRPYLARAAVAIAPLRIARGVQNKVLEALAMGKAVVASPQALTGLHAKPQTHLLLASSAREWVTALLGLLEDEVLRSHLGRAGRRYVEEQHRWEHCLTPFTKLLELAF
jgi:sugar transferase (PEP-CTERM/EpsH1 system associated)